MYAIRSYYDSNYYTGYGPKGDRQDGRPSGDAEARVFKTVPIYDAEFTKLLDEKGVTYSAVSREGNAIRITSYNVCYTKLLRFTINLLTSPGFLWAAIPSGIMALSFIGHLVAYPGTLRGLEKRLFRALGVDSWRELFRLGKGRVAGAAAGPYASVYAEAAAIRDEIVKDLKAGKGSDEFGKDMIPIV